MLEILDVTTVRSTGRRLILTVLMVALWAAVLVPVSSSPAVAQEGSSGFSDVPSGHVFEAEVDWLASTGITLGRGDGSFGVDDAVTRGAMAAFLYRYAGEPEGPFDAPAFGDVPEGHTFASEVGWLASTGITLGRGDGTFGVGDAVTRGAMAAFLYRFAGEPEGPFDAPAFADVPDGHTFATEIAWLASTGITLGRGDGTFGVGDAVTRGAMAAFLFRYDVEVAGVAPLSIVTSELPAAERGLAYSAGLEAQGGVAPYVWSVSGLPDGLELAESGLVEGMALQAGASTVEVEVTDARGLVAQATVGLVAEDVGVPEACVGQECLEVEAAAGTVELSASAAARVEAGAAGVDIELPGVGVAELPAVGGHLVLEAASELEPLVIVEVVEVVALGDGTLVRGVEAGLADAYASGVMHARGVTPEQVELASQGLVSCTAEGGAQVEVGLELSVDPIVYVEWSDRLFSGPSVKRAGVTLHADVQMVADAQLDGQVECESGFPKLSIPVSTPMGVTAYVDITPVVEFEADAELGARFEYTYSCVASVTYTDERGVADGMFCGPTRNVLQVDPLEATATVQAGLDTQVSIERLIGITGDVRAGLTGTFTPVERPAATLELFATGELGGCLGCRFGDNAITGTFLERTWGPTTIWESPTPPPAYTTTPTDGRAGTRVVGFSPVDGSGEPIADFTVRPSDAGAVVCGTGFAATGAIAEDIVACAPNSSGATNCWVADNRVTLYCSGSPWSDVLREHTATSPVPLTQPAADPAPLALELEDQRRCYRRTGGSWPGRLDGLNAVYYCERPPTDGSVDWVFDDQDFVLVGGDEPLLDESQPVWTVRMGGLSDTEVLPPPEDVGVRTVWYADRLDDADILAAAGCPQEPCRVTHSRQFDHEQLGMLTVAFINADVYAGRLVAIDAEGVVRWDLDDLGFAVGAPLVTDALGHVFGGHSAGGSGYWMLALVPDPAGFAVTELGTQSYGGIWDSTGDGRLELHVSRDIPDMCHSCPPGSYEVYAWDGNGYSSIGLIEAGPWTG